jgi:hypothetical protein
MKHEHIPCRKILQTAHSRAHPGMVTFPTRHYLTFIWLRETALQGIARNFSGD